MVTRDIRETPRGGGGWWGARCSEKGMGDVRKGGGAAGETL